MGLAFPPGGWCRWGVWRWPQIRLDLDDEVCEARQDPSRVFVLKAHFDRFVQCVDELVECMARREAASEFRDPRPVPVWLAMYLYLELSLRHGQSVGEASAGALQLVNRSGGSAKGWRVTSRVLHRPVGDVDAGAGEAGGLLPARPGGDAASPFPLPQPSHGFWRPIAAGSPRAVRAGARVGDCQRGGAGRPEHDFGDSALATDFGQLTRARYSLAARAFCRHFAIAPSAPTGVESTCWELGAVATPGAARLDAATQQIEMGPRRDVRWNRRPPACEHGPGRPWAGLSWIAGNLGLYVA